MHKQEASELFLVLGNQDRIKIMKFLYNNDIIYTLPMLENLVEFLEELENNLKVLLENNLLLKKENGYICNKEKVDELMNFITTPCGCMKK